MSHYVLTSARSAKQWSFDFIIWFKYGCRVFPCQLRSIAAHTAYPAHRMQAGPAQALKYAGKLLPLTVAYCSAFAYTEKIGVQYHVELQV